MCSITIDSPYSFISAITIFAVVYHRPFSFPKKWKSIRFIFIFTFIGIISFGKLKTGLNIIEIII